MYIKHIYLTDVQTEAHMNDLFPPEDNINVVVKIILLLNSGQCQCRMTFNYYQL